ncbi:penicillin acylase family protein [Candidatus Fermentibacteria bacterium]|nr:penicillin acylase family protein [Candidatus Fermentibacteria bacterium]
MLCLLVLIALGYLLSLWPQGRGVTRLERLPGPAVLIRDGLGVPCICADSPEAGLFSMGYAHAQDRLWQMEILRRAAWGELTRVVGDSALPLDALHRRIGFYRQALDLRPRLAEEATLLRAYAWGISAYLRAHPTRLPPEFLAARLRPALWQMEDVLAIGAMIEWLALPCSLRTQGIPGEIMVGSQPLSLASLPSGLRSFLMPILIETGQDADAVRCGLIWGAQIPQPWLETAVIMPQGQLVRGWSIPGWPLPHVAARTGELAVARQSGVNPWNRASMDGWRGVLEFLHDTPEGPCDTVRVSATRSAVSVANDGQWWVTQGSPRFTSSTIRDGIGLWGSARSGNGLLPGYDIWPGDHRAEPWHTPAPAKTNGAQCLHPLCPVPFRLLDMVTRSTAGIGGAHRPVECEIPPGERCAPLAGLVEWRRGEVRGVFMFGQSGVLFNRHRRDQYRAWSKGLLLPRDMRFPDFTHGCALVPLSS